MFAKLGRVATRQLCLLQGRSKPVHNKAYGTPQTSIISVHMAVDTDLEDVNQASPAQMSILTSIDFGCQTTVYIPFNDSGSINILSICKIQLK
jgi:hypothetical protein